MRIARDQILKRQAKRKDAEKRLHDLKPPLICEAKAVTDHAKKVKKLSAEHHDGCWLVDWDIDVLMRAVEIASGSTNVQVLEEIIGRAAEEVPLTPVQQERLDRENRNPNDTPGQMHFDEVTGEPIDVELVEAVTPESHRIEKREEDDTPAEEKPAPKKRGRKPKGGA